MRRLRGGAPGGDEDKSVAESSAEIIQKIFTTCLTDRSSGRFGKPEGKKVGVYMFANLVLKLLFAVSVTIALASTRDEPVTMNISLILLLISSVAGSTSQR